MNNKDKAFISLKLLQLEAMLVIIGGGLFFVLAEQLLDYFLGFILMVMAMGLIYLGNKYIPMAY